MRPTRFLVLSASLLAALVPLPAPAAPLYTFTDLGTLGGDRSEATAINESGQIVGGASLPDGTFHAFLFANGVMSDLGTLPGYKSSYATAINDRGQIVGTSSTSDSSTSAFFYSRGAMRALGITMSIEDSSYLSVAAINNHGEVVAYTSEDFYGKYTTDTAYLWSDGKLRTLKGIQEVFDIDDRGRILGSYGSNRARILDHGKVISPGALGKTPSWPFAMNEAGDIVGTLLENNDAPFIYSGGKITLLRKRSNGRALDVNDAGVAVGYFEINQPDYSSHAFIYFAGSAIPLDYVLLSPPGWQLETANGINNRGQIVGRGINSEGQRHAFRLDPSTSVLITGERTRITHSSRITIRGWTFGPVSHVHYSNSARSGSHAAFHLAAGAAQWQFTARLRPGRNNITVFAINPDGTSDRSKILVLRR